MSSQQANSLLPYASADAEMHSDRAPLATGGPVPWHNWHCGYSVFVDVVGGRFILVFVYSKAVCQPIS